MDDDANQSGTSAGRGTTQGPSSLDFARDSALADMVGHIDDLYAVAPVGLALFDRQFRFVHLNQHLADLHARPIAEHIGRSVFDFTPVRQHAILHEIQATVLAGGQVDNRQVVALNDEGEEIGAYLVSYRPMADRHGVVRLMACSVLDISERRRLESEARRSRERTELALSAGPVVALWLWDIQADRVSGDERFARAFGLEPEDAERGVAVETCLQRIHPEDVHRLRAIIAELRTCNDVNAGVEVRLVDASGGARWVSVNGRIEFDAAGTAVRLPGLLIDIDARVRTEERLRESEERHRLASALSDSGFWDVDPIADTLTWPASTRAMFGIFDDRPISMDDFYRGLHPADRDRTVEQYRAACDPAQRALYDVEYRTIGAEDGIVRWVSAKGRGIFDASGRCIRVLGVAQDITARKTAEASLAEARQRAERALQAGGMGDFEIGLADLSVMASPQTRALFGIEGAEGSTMDAYFSRVHPQDVDRVRDELQEAVAQGQTTLTHDYRVVAPEGSERWLAAHAEIVRDETGRAVRVRGVVQDITQRKRAERDLRHLNAELEARVAAAVEEKSRALHILNETRKLEAVGQLTGGIAHDFNNLLAAITSSVELARKRVEDPRAIRFLDAALAGAHRGANLTARLLAYARRQDLNLRPVAVGAVCEGIVEMFSRTLGPDISLALAVPDDLPLVRTDSNQLELALLNLAVNARDAMEGRGRLTITAERRRLVHDENGMAAGHYVALTVADTGAGMDAETLRRAAEPFFTTKGVGKGTGLGLSMVQGIAQQSGGGLAIESEPGAGTRVTILLPLADPDAAPPSRTRQPDPLPASIAPLTLLLVDDDALVGMGTAAMAEDLGHRVELVQSGAEALAVFAARDDIDAVVTDQGMPVMTGIELAARLHAIRPDLPILLATGYAEVPGGVRTGLPRLSKPFTQADLAAALARLVDRKA